MLTFADIAGHDRQLRRLVSLRARDAIPGTLLFSGPEGVGKRLVARAFLASLFCAADEGPCGSCPACAQIEADTFPDLLCVQPNEKGVIPIGTAEKKEPGSVRWLIERLSRRSVSGRCGVIVDGIDRVTEEGQNALLKSIEEPAAGTVIVLVTADRSRVLPTILSRCFELSFQALGDDVIARFLQTRGAAEDDARFIAHLAQGSFGAAELLGDGALCGELLALAAEITGFIVRDELLSLEIAALQKRLGAVALVNALMGIYRLNVHALAAAGDAAPERRNGALADAFHDDVFIDNFATVTALVKIFLALRAGLRYNLNVRYSLKGSLYRAREGATGFDPPDTLPENG